MERYSEYKDSGVKWLGEIPRHWELRKMKFTFAERSEKGFPSLPLLAATQNHGVIRKDQYENRTVEATKSLETLKLVDKGDFVISLRSFQGGIELSHDKGIISPAYTVLKPTHISEDYFKYFAKSPIFIALLKSMVTGIREGQNIDYSKLRENLLPLPSPQEQEKIGSYLDKHLVKIDEAIAKQHEMIDRLNERKQIIITQAVTRGLNPDVPMKDSGNKWIGMIPEHWKVCKLKRKAKIILGKMLSNTPSPLFKYFCAKDVHFGTIDTSDLKEMYFSPAERDSYNVHKGDMLIVEGGAGAGGCAVFKDGPDDIYIQNSVMIVRGIKDLDNRYICYFMQSINQRGFIEYVCNKATIPHFTKEKVGNTDMPIPPINEQIEIISKIDDSIIPIEKSISLSNQRISLLQERKQIIINEVVTGKVKV